MSRPRWVQKFGGTSVATIPLLRNAVERIRSRLETGYDLVVVVSAMGDTTDQLLSLANEVSANPARRELDLLLHAGEIQSSALLALALHEAQIPAVSLTGSQVGMRTDGEHSRAKIRSVDRDRLEAHLGRREVVVVTGFQRVSDQGEVTTLGRGGSDTSAVALAAAIKAEGCEILTDVRGVYTANPRTVENARLLDRLSYDEVLEMATAGAGVLHARSVDLARRFRVPLIVASATEGNTGSVIERPSEIPADASFDMEAPRVRAVVEDAALAKISILRVPDEPGVAARIFAVLAGEGVEIRLVVQAQSHAGYNDITLIVPQSPPVQAQALERAVEAVDGDSYLFEPRVGLLSVIGEGIASAPGVAAKIFEVLARESINIDLISSSSLVISCVVPTEQLARGAQALHRELIEAP